MAFNKSQVETVREALNRALLLDAKIARVTALSRLDVDENEDLSLNNPAQVANYLTNKAALRDAIIQAIKPVVAGWNGN